MNQPRVWWEYLGILYKVKKFQKILEEYENSKLDYKAASEILAKLEKANMYCINNATCDHLDGDIIVTFDWEPEDEKK
jgi:hypothetical protein